MLAPFARFQSWTFSNQTVPFAEGQGGPAVVSSTSRETTRYAVVGWVVRLPLSCAQAACGPVSACTMVDFTKLPLALYSCAMSCCAQLAPMPVERSHAE